MLFRNEDENGITTYMVCNDQGLCLIRTTSSRIADFVDRHSRGINPDLRLTVGGDPGTKQTKRPIFYHVRKLRTR
jgi:hypothetical protein